MNKMNNIFIFLVALSKFGVDATIAPREFQYSILGVQMTNTFDSCYFIYGIPKIGMRNFNDATGNFEGATTWTDVCARPWGKDEQEAFCRSFGWHTIDDQWHNWTVYDNLFPATDGTSPGCDLSTNPASIADCTFQGGTAACTTTPSHEFYATAGLDGYYRVQPVVFCQVGNERIDHLQCNHGGVMTLFSDAINWRTNGTSYYATQLSINNGTTNRRKRDTSDQESQIIEVNEVKKVKEEKKDVITDFLPSTEFYHVEEMGKNNLLTFPFENRDDTTDAKHEAFYHLGQQFGLRWEDTMTTGTQIFGYVPDHRRAKRNVNEDIIKVFCQKRDFRTLFGHYGECHCTDPWQGKWCEDDVDECTRNPNTCVANQWCENTFGSYKCHCNAGWTIDEATVTATFRGECIDINECEEVDLSGVRTNGRCEQNCVNFDGGYNCTCLDGYTLGKDDRSCHDINECADASTHNCLISNSRCDNYDGGYECICDAGYKNNLVDGSCENIDECTEIAKPCKTESSTCDDKEGTYQCLCAGGGGLLEDANGVCIKKTTIKVKVVVKVNAWSPAFLEVGSPEYNAVCGPLLAKLKAKDPTAKLQSAVCKIKQKTTGRRKRQTGGVDLDVSLDQTFSGELDLAEKSVATHTTTESIADELKTLDIGSINGTDFGTGTITETPQLVEAEGVTVNNTGNDGQGHDITDVCYLYNAMDHCKEGSACIKGDGGMPECKCAEGFTGESCDQQVVSALSTSTIFLMAACIALFFALLGLCFSHMYHMRKLHALEKFVGYRYHVLVTNDGRQPIPHSGSSMGDTLDQPRSWLPQPMRRHHGQQPAYFSHWN